MVCYNAGNDELQNPATDCVSEEKGEGYVVDGGDGDAWLEMYVIGGFRVWQILLLGGTILTTIVTFLCCCIRFRIPRTKQEIETDWERREMAREFERRMKRIIGHEEGSKLDLRKALERVHADVVREEEEKRKKEKEEEVRIRIRDGGCECDDIETARGRRKIGGLEQNYVTSNSPPGTENDGKGVTATPSLGWKTTSMIARVFYNTTRTGRNN